MADEPTNLVLEHLRAMRPDVATLREDMREVKSRLINVEIVITSVLAAQNRMQHTLDRHGDRLEKIERRLGRDDETI